MADMHGGTETRGAGERAGAGRKRSGMEDLRESLRSYDLGDTSPEMAFDAVICTLERAISGGEDRKLESALRDDLQELARACGRHRQAEAESFRWPAFLNAVREHLGAEADPELAVRAVFHAVRRAIPAAEAEDIASQLSSDLREVWLRPEAEPA